MKPTFLNKSMLKPLRFYSFTYIDFPGGGSPIRYYIHGSVIALYSENS